MKDKIVVVINIIGIILAFLIVELIIYQDANKIFQKINPNKGKLPFSYTSKPAYWYDINTYYSGANNNASGRKPDGLKYNSTPIVIFGCSYAHGQYLNYNQTFSYKLSEQLKRPVYNRAVPGKGLAKMYFQSQNDTFYKDVPKSNLVFYVMIEDHYRRMKSSYQNTVELHMNVSYKKVGDKLIINDYKNPIACFLHSTYIAKYITNKWINHYINDPKNAEKLTDEALLYFTETRKNLENRWGTKVNFVVIYYNHWLRYGDLLRNKLEANGFTVINTKELTDENLFSDKYLSPQTMHPTEAAWDLLTPKIVEKLGLKEEK